MNVISNSNQQSSLFNSLAKYEADPALYSIGDSTPNASTQELVVVNPKTAAAVTAADLLFDPLPRNGFLKEAMLKVVFEVDNTEVIGASAALELFNYISLQSSRREIERLYPKQIRSWIENQPEPKRSNMLLAVNNGSVTSTATVTHTFYCPLPFSFAMDPQLMLNTRFFENLSIVASQRAFAGNATSAAPNSATISLVCRYVSYDESAYQEHINSNFSADKPLEMLTRTCYKEAPNTGGSVASGVATFSDVALGSKGLIRKTIVAVWDKSTAYVPDYVPLATVELKGSGRTLYKDDNCLGVSLLWSRKNFSATAAAAAAAMKGTKGPSAIYEIDWSMVKVDDELRANHGCISLKNIASPTIDVTTDAQADATETNNQLEVYHEMYQLMSVDSRNGTVSVSQSS